VLPSAVIALALLWFGDYTAKVQWTLTLVIGACALGFVLSAREHVVRPLQTMSNLLAALREGDYSIRARGAKADDALGEVLLEINALGETLRTQRLGAFEATALLRTIMAEIDVSVFTFDPERRLRLVNRAGEDLLQRPIDKVLGRKASELGLEVVLEADENSRSRSRSPAARVGGRAAEFIPRTRSAARAGGAHRPEQDAARRGTERMAAHRAGARPRAEQLARADQVDRRQPGDIAAARSAAAGLAG
jgi:PAS domain-containing protein